MKPLRIGILTHKYPKTKEDRVDARIHIYDFAHRLAGHAQVFVFASDPGGEKEVDLRVPVTWFSTNKSSYRLISQYIDAWNMFRQGNNAVLSFVKRNDIDFCLAAWAIPAGYWAYTVKRELGTPYAVWALGSDIHTFARYPIVNHYIRKWLVSADLRFANSYRLCDDIMRLSGKDCTFMPVISDFPTYLRKERLNFSKPFQFLYVGRLEKIKGIDILIRACILLKERNVAFHLDAVGDGSLRKQLEREIKKKSLDEDILFLGNQDKGNVIKHMRDAECLVIPSREESFPQVLLEAAKVGLPVIATHVGDCPRIVRTYRCGMLAQKNNPHALAKAMNQSVERRHQLIHLYGKGLRKFVDEFTRTPPETILMQKLKDAGL